ncbi:ABC transporter ATP-binding protein [Shewanella surugensis]|uniref:ABC transporter ATP-binding protein n=1 Tax=Shewanella surugensis TaxID=212020 RepID=A0ABT0L9K7_9GAMM|nr:ABC transporter ATP-binding protein [Shewanella surugensis]MCL1124396.1 ABC transporter ATP-binding protein [Shewanella surugensis]
MKIDSFKGLICQIEQQSPIRLVVNFDCKAGELLAVVGSSGGGKSTLLRMLAGLSLPQVGHIQCGDRLWYDTASQKSLSPAERHVGYVPQHFGLFPHLTALDNILAGLDHVPKQERMLRATQWLAKMKLSHLGSRRPRHLSGGQQQRIALARALVREPELLLLDEPFSAVDWEAREFLYEALLSLKSSLNIPVVMVTHDLKEALLLADKMMLMDNGFMLQQGTPHQILSQPKSEIVARQMGLRNIFDGIVDTHSEPSGSTWLTWQGMTVAVPYQQSLEEGMKVRWTISNLGIEFANNLLVKQQVNCFVVCIVSLITMGDMMRLTVSLQENNQRLHLELSIQVVNQLALVQGGETMMMLNPSFIHVFSSSD